MDVPDSSPMSQPGGSTASYLLTAGMRVETPYGTGIVKGRYNDGNRTRLWIDVRGHVFELLATKDSLWRVVH